MSDLTKLTIAGARDALRKGETTSVALTEACLQARVGEEVVGPANFNAPMQTVIAGHAAAVGRAGVLARARGAKVIPLKVSAPFHCPLMESARERLAARQAS